MRALLAAALLIAGAAVAEPAAPDVWTPTPELVAKVEAQLQMPTGVGDFHAVRRTFWGMFQKGRRVMYVQYRMHEPGGITIVPTDGQGRIVRDGGCSFVNVTYDVDTDTIVHVGCEGLA